MIHEDDTKHDSRDQENTQGTTIPVVQEFLDISKRTVETGAVRVRTVTEDEIVKVETERRSRTAKIERRPRDVRVDAEYDPHQEGDEWVVPVFEYKPVVTMQLFLKEEIRITSEIENIPEVAVVPLRRQHVVIERRESDSDDWREVDAKP